MDQPSTPRGRPGTVPLLLIWLFLMGMFTAAGCSQSGPQGEPSRGPSSQATEPARSPVAQEGASVRPEDTAAPETAVAGGAGVSVELAGLPVGGGSASAVGDAWCQVLSWRTQLPEGVRLDIAAVALLQPGATLEAAGCDQQPDCVGSIITGGTPSCSVLVRPPSPQTPSLTIRLDGTLRCPDEASCRAVGATDGETYTIVNPGGAQSEGRGDEQTSPDVGVADGGSATPTSTP